MKKNISFVFLLLLFCFYTAAQKLTVIDKNTRQTVPGMVIYAGNNIQTAVVTNSKGQADISSLKGNDTIYFKHVSYEFVGFLYSQLESMRFIVELSESKISLGEVVISGNRWEQGKIEVPGRIEKISMREVSFQNTQTSADMLGSSGYAYIQKSQLAGGSPMLRGFSANRVMLVVDGVRMNNAIFRAGNLQNVISIDANALEGAEILFGPGAVMYGSDAIGGVMDFHTLQPKLSSEKILFTGSAYSRFSSANTEKTGHLDFNIGAKKWAFVTSFSYADYDDLRTGSKGNSYFLRPTYQETINGVDTQLVNSDPSVLVHSGFSQTNFMQKIRFKPNESWDFDYAFHYSVTSDAPRYDRLYLDGNGDSLLDFAQWYYGPQNWMMNRMGVIHTKDNKLFNQLRLVAAMQNYEESRHDRRFNNQYLRNQTETVDAISVNLDLDKKINEKATLFYGAEFVHNTVGSVANRVHIVTGVEEPTNTRYPNGSTWQSLGAYANLKYKLDTNWILNVGVRYSHVKIEAEFDTSLFPFPFVRAENSNGAFNGSAGIVYSPNKTVQIYFNMASGFRAPNIDDIGKVFDSEPGSVVVPNANLKPEYAYNAEVGFAKVISDIMKMDMSIYYTYLDNSLARRNFSYNGLDSIEYDGQLSQVQAIQNITKAYVYGVQAGVDINFGKGFGLKSTVNYQYGEEQSEDSLIYYPKSHLAPMFGSTHFTYKRRMLKFDLYADYNAGLAYDDLALSERNDDAPYAKDANGLPFVPSWYTINFKGAWYINKYLALNAGVENITDQLYRPYASGISAPGRNFIASLKCVF